MGGIWYGFGKAVGELPFGEIEWFSAADMCGDKTAGWSWSQELLFHCAIWGGWTMDFSGSWWWTWVWGKRGGAFGQGQVALVADMGGNMTSR